MIQPYYNSDGYFTGSSDHDFENSMFLSFDEENIQIYNLINQENTTAGEVTSFDYKEIEMQINNDLKYVIEVENMREYTNIINECEDYDPSETNEPDFKPREQDPLVLYYFNGQNPITKKFEFWQSTDINSKSPPTNPNLVYKYVALIQNDQKAL